MNTAELETKLAEKKILPCAYCINGIAPIEQYCLEENYGKWHVYYSEKGKKRDEKIFSSESDACQYFYNLVADDPTTHMLK